MRREAGRAALILLHRWVGLVLAAFLVVLGLTGGILAFEDELDAWLSPQLRLAEPPAPGSPMLDADELAYRAQAALPRAQISQLPLQRPPGRSVRMRVYPRVDPGTGRPFVLDYNEAFFDPYDARLLGTRMWGELQWDRTALVGFVYRLHSMLALPPSWGRLLLGVLALVWTLDCVVGLLLTFPRSRPGRGVRLRAWFSRWMPAWSVKFGASLFRLNLDLHRASGLWLWLLLLMFAWSSVMFTLRDQVYLPVMSRLVTFNDPLRSMPARPGGAMAGTMDWTAALQAGRAHARALARRHGWRIQEETLLALARPKGVYSYWIHTDLDIRDGDGATGVVFDAASGALTGVVLPRDPTAAGNAFNQWMYGLHMAQVFGLPYRILVLLAGLATAMLSVTGVIIWWRKRAARRHAARAAASAAARRIAR
ncbi:iron-regulated membrane protein [Bordetella ansorpii]|uniref:Iron-regulated membrane protein n=1 Tax=Bordetella ansorpii TaxID=288768 RepID=A0A157SVN7_9BORD|nr:PepSY-associated TM helix domain-containing protein [Bordetella ansorpii]SAI74509.1 iron-regulated membrane protein [Bordetella ansorpii]